MSERRKPRDSLNCFPTNPDTAVSALHKSDFLECISDRVDQRDQYPFEGNEDLIEQVMKSISAGGSVLIVGEPGRGKRTLSLGLARRFADLQKQDPTNFSYARFVYTLALGPSFWDHGSVDDITEVQKRIREVLRLVEAAGPENIVFCIDDVDVLSFVDKLAQKHCSVSGSPITTSGAGQDSEMSSENMLRTLLFNRKVVCLCTCIRAAYQRLIDTDTFYDEKFTKTFRVFHMPEPSITQTLQMVRGHRTRIEMEYGVALLDEALVASTVYAKHYLIHREMPESALDVLSEAAKKAISGSIEGIGDSARTSGGTKVVVGKKFVNDLIADWCGYSAEHLNLVLSEKAYHGIP